MSTRVMNGLVNMEGSKVNTLQVGDLVARRPEPTYRTTCQRCGTVATATHSRLRSGAATCAFSGCGQPVKPSRERLHEHRQQVAEREAQRIADERKASELRMEIETEGHNVKRTPFRIQESGPMSDRDRRSIREFRDAEEAERLAAEAPRLEAERQAAQDRQAADAVNRDREEKHRQYWADWVSTDSDPKFFVTDEVRSASMPKARAEEFTAKAAAEFAKSPEYALYRTLENADIILGYLHRNGCFIADVQTINAAFVRLKSLGMLKAKAAAEPRPRIEPEPTVTTMTAATPTTVAHQAPQTYRGRDQSTGELRDFTRWEVDHMSAEQYKRTFGTLESFSELFTKMNAR